MTCADDALAVEGCIGTAPPPAQDEPRPRRCYPPSTDLRTACKQLLGRACPTFPAYAVESGMLDPTFESEESTAYLDTGYQLIGASHLEMAARCTTISGRSFSWYMKEDSLLNLDYEYVISDTHVTLVFDELGRLEAISWVGPTCCSGDGADAAWWGDSHHPMSGWCHNENADCETYDCVQLTPDDIRALVESQRR